MFGIPSKECGGALRMKMHAFACAVLQCGRHRGHRSMCWILRLTAGHCVNQKRELHQSKKKILLVWYWFRCIHKHDTESMYKTSWSNVLHTHKSSLFKIVNMQAMAPKSTLHLKWGYTEFVLLIEGPAPWEGFTKRFSNTEIQHVKIIPRNIKTEKWALGN